MAGNETKRIATQIIQADVDAFLGFKAVPGYQPINPAFSLDTVTELHEALRAADEAEVHTQNAYAAARDAATAAQWKFHNAMLGVKNQILAQFGPDSDQVAALGLKKKSERKKPARRSKAAT